MQAFPVRLRSGAVFWTVLDDALGVVAEADAYLQQLQFGRDAAESTTKAYAGALALYLGWCAATGQSWASDTSSREAYGVQGNVCASTPNSLKWLKWRKFGLIVLTATSTMSSSFRMT